MSEPAQSVESAAEVENDDNTAAIDDETRERDELNSYINELKTKIDQKIKLRNENLNCVRPGEEFFFKLDSSLKKNTAFVKKLKQFTAAQLDSLLKDMSTLNLTKYISEVSSALSEAKIKLTDVSAAITLCSELHRVYADFPNAFLENWQKILSLKQGEKVQNLSKLRVDLKFFAELVSVGIFSNKQGLPMLGSFLMSLIAQDKEEFNNLSIILSFCRHCGEEYAGLVPKSILASAKVSITLFYTVILRECYLPLIFYYIHLRTVFFRNSIFSYPHQHCLHPIVSKISKICSKIITHAW